jgi:hypothetical protein
MRKQICLVVCLLASITVSYAEGNRTSCEDLYDVAKQVMENRQAGVPMPPMMRIAGDNELLRTIVQQAYEMSIYSSDTVRRRAVEGYAEVWYRECLKHTDER